MNMGENATDEWDLFKLPFNVATVPEFQQRAFVSKDEQTVEWQWLRVHAWCGATQPPGRMMMLNKASMLEELACCQVPSSEWKYRGVGEAQEETPFKGVKSHGLGCRAYFVMLLWLLKNRALSVVVKERALKLFLGMATLAFAALCAPEEDPIMAMLVDHTGSFRQSELFFKEAGGLCRGAWASLLQGCRGGLELWSKLRQTTWLGRCIITPVADASLEDVLHFLLWICCHPKARLRGQNLMACIGKVTLPRFLVKIGSWLSLLAVKLTKQELDTLPILQTKTGYARKQADPVNRMILLYRLRSERLHRRRVADTHRDVGAAAGRMVRYESYINCMLHHQCLKDTFQDESQICVCWDPSSYTGKEVLVAAVYSSRLDKAAWLLNQELPAVMMGDLDDALLPLARTLLS